MINIRLPGRRANVPNATSNNIDNSVHLANALLFQFRLEKSSVFFSFLYRMKVLFGRH